jgi:ketosteroid isomerase-like protein
MDHILAARFVEQWAGDWNAHDLEALLSHLRDDVVTFDGELVALGHGTYRAGSDNPAGVRSA